jgi:ssDNA-binding Zn-finger/Zn-ribbon topoisomerase 1
MTRPCPACGGALAKYHGAISDPIMNTIRGNHAILRRTRPATFWACGACEHCEEHDAKLHTRKDGQ